MYQNYFVDGKMSGCNAGIYYTTGMRQVASTNLSIGEEGRQKILTGD